MFAFDGSEIDLAGRKVFVASALALLDEGAIAESYSQEALKNHATDFFMGTMLAPRENTYTDHYAIEDEELNKT